MPTFTSYITLALSPTLVWARNEASAGSRASSRDISNQNEFDYVVVGGGLTGLVVANRLSENQNRSVLVVENGYIDLGYAAEVPYASNTLNTADMWDLTSAPIPGLNYSTYHVSVGSVVGGGSVVNGMACDRGSISDYNSWKALGNPNWGWDGLFPYFLKSTNFTPPLPEHVEEYNMTWDPSVWGDRGPVQVSFPTIYYEDAKTAREAWISQGIPNLQDGANGNPLGLYWMPQSVDRQSGKRSSARATYYDPAAHRPNLELLTGHRVTEILFADGTLTATGVKITNRQDNSTSQAYARKEVILAAGAVFTPYLLQRSGIGPRKTLEAGNIPIKRDLPSVGANFQDHPVAYMSFNVSNLTFPNPTSILTNATYNQSVWQEYLDNHTGPYAMGRGDVSGIMFLPLSDIIPTYESLADNITSQHALDYLPDIYQENETLLKGYMAQREILVEHILGKTSAQVETSPAITGSFIALQKPLSRGTISLNPENVDGTPVIKYNTLMNPIDTAIFIASVRFQRNHWKLPVLGRYSPVESAPGAQYQTDDEILEGLISSGIMAPSFAHPSGTCAMMSEDLGGCVGPDLRVFGTRQLSIVDASILPLIPATHLQMTMYAVAEKAADIIKARDQLAKLFS